MQGQVLVYVMPGMFVPNAAQSMQTVNGKRATRCCLLALLAGVLCSAACLVCSMHNVD